MNDANLVIPILLIACGILAMAVYVLVLAIRDMAKQMTKANDCLLLAVIGKEGTGQGQALLARMLKPDVPSKKVPEKLRGVAAKTQPQMTMKMGSI